MRIAYFGYDFFIDALEGLLQDGHELVHVQTYNTDGKFTNRNERTLALASRLGVPVGWGKTGCSELQAMEVDAVLVMAFKYRVPVVEGKRMVNLHPVLLPEGRGEFPLPWLILHHPEHSGLTLHRITDKMDEGPILAQAPVPVSEEESLDTLCAKMRLAAVEFMRTALRDFDVLWDKATLPENEGSYWEATETDWRLPWSEGYQRVIQTVRAFGVYESEAIVDGEAWSVTDAAAWKVDHSYEPGSLVHTLPNGIVVAASDGLVLLRNPVREQSQ